MHATKFLRVLAAIFVTLTGMASHAVTGNELLRQCRETERLMEDSRSRVDQLSAGYCIGLVEGIKNTLTMVSSQAKTNCMPASATNEQAVRIVLKHLRNNPERLHLDGSVLVIESLGNAFTCGQ